jgi:hypothetical protein
MSIPSSPQSIIMFRSIYIRVVVLVVAFAACSKSDTVMPDPTVGLTKIATGYATGAAAKVEVYALSSNLTTGYQPLWIALYDSVSEKRITDAHVTMLPMMDMGSMKHSSPVENPASHEAVNQLFPGAVVFIMSSMGGSWTIDINVHNHSNNKEGKLTIPVTVAEPSQKKLLSFTSAIDNTTKYFLAMVEPAKPKVGINNLEFVLYKKASMMSFPADSSLSISFEPEMPTMNHGSPNNVNPVHSGNGHYKGKVNFTMTGLWRLQLQLKSGTQLAKADSLDIDF